MSLITIFKTLQPVPAYTDHRKSYRAEGATTQRGNPSEECATSKAFSLRTGKNIRRCRRAAAPQPVLSDRTKLRRAQCPSSAMTASRRHTAPPSATTSTQSLVGRLVAGTRASASVVIRNPVSGSLIAALARGFPVTGGMRGRGAHAVPNAAGVLNAMAAAAAALVIFVVVLVTTAVALVITAAAREVLAVVGLERKGWCPWWWPAS
ncbi:hypothetical protein B0J12DRAFT_698939 [Macrophomina phaseolina]|uniref:Uncharacterized protein n=1 Tax=Macrophomina phaseolina TaxID=35725 RepID=A0ABQ8GDS6_9PEZI|nr:hypothetical protein B0J12DRAFT_698939 [Macrophomina phaseolina]